MSIEVQVKIEVKTSSISVLELHDLVPANVNLICRRHIDLPITVVY